MMRQSIAIAIDYLANCPEFLDALAQLSWKEWQEIYQQREQTLEDCLKNYRRANEQRSVAADTCCGPSRTGGKLPGARRDGVTKVSRYGYPAGFGPLVRRAFSASGMEKPRRGNDADARATEEARRLNVPRLYLWTHSAEGLYRKLGWQVVERSDYFGKEAVVMQIDLSRQ